MPIAVTTRQPNPAFPGLPSLTSVTPAYAGSVWISVFAQSGIPAPLAQRLNREFNEIAAAREMSAILNQNGLPPLALSMDELRTRMREEYNGWKKIAVDKKIVLE